MSIKIDAKLLWTPCTRRRNNFPDLLKHSSPFLLKHSNSQIIIFLIFFSSSFSTLQTPCRLRNFSIISVLALTVSNVFLTLRLLQVSDCGHNNDHAATAVVPKAPVILTPATACLEYVLADTSINASEKAVFSGLDLQLGRWDARRMYKVFDFAVVGEKFAELSEKLNVTLATQSSIEKIFSLVQGKV